MLETSSQSGGLPVPCYRFTFPNHKSSTTNNPRRDVAAENYLTSHTRPCGTAVLVSKAEHQKKRYEQQLAAQSSSKRSQIDFTPSAVPTKHQSRSQQQAKETDNPYYSQRHSDVGSRPRQRFHPYASRGDATSNAYLREKARWG